MIRKKNCDLHKTTACAGVAAFTLNVTRKIDVNTRDGVGNTPIVYAILGGNMEAARELRLLGAKLDGICRNGGSALHLAATKTDTAWLQWAISEGGNLEAKTTVGRTPFHVACQFGNLEGAKYLMGLGVDISANGDTATHLCASSGNTELLSMLMKSLDVERIDHPNKIGWSPLHVAANYGHVELTRALISAEVDVHRKGMDGRNALDVASSGGWDDVVEVLVAAMAARPFDGHIRLDEIRSSKRICGRRSLGEKCPTTANLKSSEPQGLLKDLLERQRSRLEELEMKSSGGKLPKYDSKTNVQQTCVRLPAPTAVVPINNKSTRPSSRNGTISGPSPGVDIVTISGERLTSSSLAIDTCPSSNISEGQLKSSVLTFQLSACPLTAAGESSTSSSTPTHFDISSNDRADNASPIPQLPHSPLRAVTTVGKGLTSSAPSDDSHHVSPINCHSADDETPVVSLPLSPLNAVTTSSTPSIENSISSINDHRADDELPDHMLPSPLNAITSLSPSIDSQSISPVSHFKADKETPIPSSPPPLNTSAATGVISSPRPSLIPIPVGSSIKSASGERKRNIPTDIVSVGRDHGGVGLLKGGKSTIVQQPMTERRVRRKSLDAKIVGSKQQMSFREVIGSTGIDDEHTDQSGPSREAIERGLDGMAYVIIKGICAAAAAVVASSENSSYLTQRRNNSAGSLRSSADVAAAICHDYSIESNQATNMPAATFTPVSSCSESPVQLRHDDLPSPSIGCIISDTVEIRSTDIASTGADPLGLQCFSPIVQNIKYSPSLSSSVVLEDGAETQIDSPADGSDSASEIFYSSADNTLPAPPREAIERGLDGMGYVIIKGICAAAAAVVASSENSSYLSQHHNSSAGSLRSSADVAAAICHDYSIERNKKTAIPLHTIENETSSTTSALQLKRDSSPTVSNPVSARSVSPVKKASTLGRSSSTPTSGVKETVADKVKRDSSPTVSKNPVSARSVSPVKKASTLGRSSSTPTSGVKETVADKVKRDSSPTVSKNPVSGRSVSPVKKASTLGRSSSTPTSGVKETVADKVKRDSSPTVSKNPVSGRSVSPVKKASTLGRSSSTPTSGVKETVADKVKRDSSPTVSKNPVSARSVSPVKKASTLGRSSSTPTSGVKETVADKVKRDSSPSVVEEIVFPHVGSTHDDCCETGVTESKAISESPVYEPVSLSEIVAEESSIGIGSVTDGINEKSCSPQTELEFDSSNTSIYRGKKPVGFSRDRYLSKVPSRPVESDDESSDDVHSVSNTDSTVASVVEAKIEGHEPLESYDSTCDLQEVSSKGSPSRCPDSDITDENVIQDSPEEYSIEATSRKVRLAKIKDKKARLEAARNIDSGLESTTTLQGDELEPQIDSSVDVSAHDISGNFVDTFRNVSDVIDPVGKESRPDSVNCNEDLKDTIFVDKGDNTYFTNEQELKNDRAGRGKKPVGSYRDRYLSQLSSRPVESDDESSDDVHSVSDTDSIVASVVEAKIEDHTASCTPHKGSQERCTDFDITEVVVVLDTPEENISSAISQSSDDNGSESDRIKRNVADPCLLSVAEKAALFSGGSNLSKRMVPSGNDKLVDKDTASCGDDMSLNEMNSSVHDTALPFGEQINSDGTVNDLDDALNLPQAQEESESCITVAGRIALFDRQRLKAEEVSSEDSDDDIQKQMERAERAMKAHISENLSRTTNADKSIHNKSEEFPLGISSASECNSGNDISASPCEVDSAAHENSYHREEDETTGASSAIRSPDIDSDGGNDSLGEILMKHETTPEINEDEYVTPAMPDEISGNNSTALSHNSNEKVTPDFDSEASNHIPKEPSLARRRFSRAITAVRAANRLSGGMLSRHNKPINERVKESGDGTKHIASRVSVFGGKKKGKLAEQSPDPDTSNVAISSNENILAPSPRLAAYLNSGNSKQDDRALKSDTEFQRGVASFRRQLSRSSSKPFVSEIEGVTVDYAELNGSTVLEDVGASQRKHEYDDPVLGRPPRHENTDTAGVSFDESVLQSTVSEVIDPEGERTKHPTVGKSTLKSVAIGDEGHGRLRDSVHRGKSEQDVGGIGERESIGEGAVRSGHDHEIVDNERLRERGHRNRSSRELVDNERHRERVHRSRSSRDVGGTGERESIGEGAVRGGGDRHREGVRRSRSSRDVGGTGERESIGEGDRHREGVHRSRSSRELDDNERHRERVHRSRSSRNVGGTGERESIGEGALRGGGDRHRDGVHRSRSSRELDDNGRHRERVHRSRSSRDVGGIGERESIGEGAVRGGGDRHREGVHRSRSSRDVGGTGERESIGEGAVRGGSGRHREGVHRSRSSRELDDNGRHRDRVHRSRSSRDVGGTGERESIGEGAVRSRHDHDIADNERLRERSHRNRSSRELDDNGRHRKRVHRSRSSRDVGGTGERESIGEGAVRSGHDHEIADNERLRERGHRNRSSRELDDNERHRERVHRSRSSRDVGGTSERESIGEGAVRGGGDRHREGVHRSRSSRDAGGIGERESIGGVDRHREGVHRSRSSRDITSSDPAGLDETVAGNSRSRRNSSLTSLTERRVRRKSTDSKPIGHSNGLSQIGGSERGDSLPSKDSRSIQESASVANDNDSNAQSGSLTVVSSRRAYDRARRRAARSGRSPREHVDGDWLSHSVMELSASSEEDGVLTPVARDRKGRPTISRANSATHRGVQDKIDAWAKDYDSIAQEEVQGENELASELHAWLKMSHDHSDVEKAATPPVSVQDPLDKVDSFDSYVSYSVQRSLEIEWRLSQLESKMPDPDVIHTIRTLLHGKTQVIKKLKNRHNLSPDEISSLRSDLRRMRIEMLDLVKHETSSLRDPENVIKEELESISAL